MLTSGCEAATAVAWGLLLGAPTAMKPPPARISGKPHDDVRERHQRMLHQRGTETNAVTSVLPTTTTLAQPTGGLAGMPGNRALPQLCASNWR